MGWKWSGGEGCQNNNYTLFVQNLAAKKEGLFSGQAQCLPSYESLTGSLFQCRVSFLEIPSHRKGWMSSAQFFVRRLEVRRGLGLDKLLSSSPVGDLSPSLSLSEQSRTQEIETLVRNLRNILANGAR
jgi:hypothetical protein